MIEGPAGGRSTEALTSMATDQEAAERAELVRVRTMVLRFPRPPRRKPAATMPRLLDGQVPAA